MDVFTKDTYLQNKAFLHQSDRCFGVVLKSYKLVKQ